MKTFALAASLMLTGCLGPRGAGPAVPDPVPDVAGADESGVSIVQARLRATNAHDWSAWEALHTDACVRTAPELDQPIRGAAEMRAAIERLVEAVPDYHVGLVRLLGHGPWYAAEFVSQGAMTHALEVPGKPLAIPATNRRFRQRWMAFLRVEGGRIAELHERYDRQDLADQLTGKAYPKSWE